MAIVEPPDADLQALYDELATPGPLVLGQLGQSLDGRIATASGHSHYINDGAALTHLHRLRALVDAVLVGAGTVAADDPQLTVRRVSGPNPARIAIDPRGRLADTARIWTDDGCRRLVVTAVDHAWPAGVEVVRLAGGKDGFAPQAILTALRNRGLGRVLVEGGALTVSRFLAARALDRLHIAVAPLLIGAGPTGIDLPPVLRLDEVQRPPTRSYRLGIDTLFDCDLRRR